MIEEQIRIYIAASSKDVERAECWTSRLAATGRFIITSAWVDEVKVNGSNKSILSHDQRYKLADDCQAGVENADVVWVLMPVDSSMGAFWEFGFATAYKLATCVSGNNQHASVFTALAKYRFETDEQAFDFISNVTMKRLYGDLD